MPCKFPLFFKGVFKNFREFSCINLLTHCLLLFFEGADTIEGIFLDLSKIRDKNLNPQAFANMPNLRFFKFYMPKLFGISDMVCKLHLPQGLQHLSDELRYPP